jgi:hypothetical protein
MSTEVTFYWPGTPEGKTVEPSHGKRDPMVWGAMENSGSS